MLRLLAQREEGYEDIAALMGLSVDEVRAKVKEALEGLDDPGSAPKPPEPPKQPPQSPKPPPPKPTPPPPPPASDDVPKPQKAKIDGKPAPRARSSRAPRQRPTLKLPTSQGARLGILAGAAATVLLVVLLLVTGGSGDEGSSSDAAATGTNDSGSTVSNDGESPFGNKRVTGAILSPPDGGDASGLAVLGRAGKEPLLQVEAKGLEPSPDDATYTIWLYKSPKLALRAGAVEKVGENGILVAQLPVPLELLQYIAAGAFNQIDISLTADAAYEAEVAAAEKGKRLPRYTGTSVLRGEIVGPLANGGEVQGG